jgi:hypothetical protein
MENLISSDSPAGQAFSLYCSGDLDIAAMSADSRDELASVARMWLDTPAIADSSVAVAVRGFIAALDTADDLADAALRAMATTIRNHAASS